MTGAMYAAVSGLKAHMNKLNVIGNNVANVNTYGYKAARTTFSDSLYTSMRAGSNGSNSMGGVNPAQFGFGAHLALFVPGGEAPGEHQQPAGRARQEGAPVDAGGWCGGGGRGGRGHGIGAPLARGQLVMPWSSAPSAPT